MPEWHDSGDLGRHSVTRMVRVDETIVLEAFPCPHGEYSTARQHGSIRPAPHHNVRFYAEYYQMTIYYPHSSYGRLGRMDVLVD